MPLLTIRGSTWAARPGRTLAERRPRHYRRKHPHALLLLLTRLATSLLPYCLLFCIVQANVMLEYTYEEAAALLAENLKAAHAKKQEVEEDMDFLKDQITCTEVNVARAYNFDVVQRREAKRKQAAAGGGGAQ